MFTCCFGLEGCTDPQATGAISSTVSAGVGYKSEDCESAGWTGKASIGKGELKVVVSLDGLGWESTWELWEGAEF